MKLLCLITALFTLAFPSLVVAEDGQKAVLITGASSGIGRYAAEHLAAQGYFVYAGARKDADMAALNEIENVMAVRLDVTDHDQINATVALIEDEGRGLWGLVNNAGVNVVAPMLEFEEDDFEFVFDVNVFGVYRVTKAFGPMIIESQGRIVNISSISGILSGPGYSAYAASKHAVEAMTDALAWELREHGAVVTSVNPGNYASQIGLTRCKRLLADPDAENWGLWEERRQDMIKSCDERLAAGVDGEGTPPDGVALAIEQALFEDNPRDRYLIVPRQVEAGWTISRAIEELLAFNNRHEFSYSRDELVELIDYRWPYAEGEKSVSNPDDAQAWREFLQSWMNKGVVEEESQEE